MGKTLVIAEKPSVAKDIVRALQTKYGRFADRETHFESGDWLVSSAVGHLVEIYVEEARDPKKDRWKLDKLPMIPEYFDLRGDDKTKQKLNQLVRLINDPKVDTLINACDAGREGELIFRLIVQYAGKKAEKKTVKRLWLQSMTNESILHGFDNLRSDAEMKGLEDAARSRSEADWLVGINATRALTAFNSQNGGFFLTTAGRVQTPTLSLVVEREDKIQNHVPRLYAECEAVFEAEAGEYKGKLFDPTWKKGDDPDDKADRYWDTPALAEMTVGLSSLEGIVSETWKPSSDSSPPLFDLTALQRECNSRFGLSAKTTLSIAQSLYERHKVLTYPRTDSKHLPEDYVDGIKGVFESFAGSNYDTLSGWARKALDGRYVWPNKKIFDNTKISDHFAITPTGKIPTGLEELERKVYDLVAKRTLAVFYPPAEYLVGTRITKVKDLSFKSEGKVMKVPGWRAIYGADVGGDSDKILVPVKEGEKVSVPLLMIEEDHTKPPPRYNEASLLGAMESVGKQMSDAETKEAMKGKGLGTPATRAAIIENMISEAFVVREGKEMTPTPKASQLLVLLKELNILDLTSPELTGEWEYRLSLMEEGKLSREVFMRDINTMITGVCEKLQKADIHSLKGDYAAVPAGCPSCSSPITGHYREYICDDADCCFRLPRTFAGHLFTPLEVATLITKREIGPLKLRSRKGREFTTKLLLKAESGKWTLAFPESDKPNEMTQDEIGNALAISKCPCCDSTVYKFEKFYSCEKALGAAPSCKFKVTNTLLQQHIGLEQIVKLCEEGKTDTLTGFISKKFNKAFQAWLVWDKKAERVSFVFPPKQGKPYKKK